MSVRAYFASCIGHRVVVGMEQLLKGPGCKKVPTRIWCDDDAISVAQSFDKSCVVPIFTVSAVRSIGLQFEFHAVHFR